MEMVYQMASRTDPETMRFLNDVIVLYTQVNPDGQELVANWYMREKDPLKRSLAPACRGSRTSTSATTTIAISTCPTCRKPPTSIACCSTNGFPQIIYNHHQTGPAGAVIFMPPFRDPFNYNFDPLVPLGIEMVGTAMHSRLVAEGKGGIGHAQRRELFHLVERRPAHHHLFPQLDRHPDRNHRHPDARSIFRWSPISSCRKATGRCRSRRPRALRMALPPVDRLRDHQQSRDSRLRLALSRDVPLQHLSDGQELDRKGQPDNWTVTPKRIAALEAAAAKMAAVPDAAVVGTRRGCSRRCRRSSPV